MFAKQVNSALCLENYKDLHKGASVPVSNELYAQVEEWLESNDWAEIPDGFFDPVLTYDQESKALNAAYVTEIQRLSNEYNIAVARDGTTETNKVTAARSKITASDSQYSAESDALIIKYFS